MDTALKYKLDQMEQMLRTLEEATGAYAKKIALLNAHDYDGESINLYSDSVIKRLEYCVDHFWKLLKAYLENAEGIALTENGPKSIARAAALHRIISEQESQQLIKMIQERNNMSHMYKQEVADEIARFAPHGLIFMKTIITRLQNHYATQKDLA